MVSQIAGGCGIAAAGLNPDGGAARRRTHVTAQNYGNPPKVTYNLHGKKL